MATPLPNNPWIPEQPTWFDEKFAATFLEAIEPAPLFLDDPSPEYMGALWTLPIAEILAAYRR